MTNFPFFRGRMRENAAFASFVTTRLRPLRTTTPEQAQAIIEKASSVARVSNLSQAPVSAAAAMSRGTPSRLAVFTAAALPIAMVAAVLVVLLPDNAPTGFDEELTEETAVVAGFAPTPMPPERGDDYVIVTIDTDDAASVIQRFPEPSGTNVYVLAQRSQQITLSIPTAFVSFVDDLAIDVQPDTRVTSLDVVTQSPVPSWGLDRIDALDTPLDGSYSFVSTGNGVRVYVVDTGVRADHRDLQGRVGSGWSAIADGQGTNDCNGHGTHVAGTVAGERYGVAKQATIVPIRVLDCAGSGFASSIVSGVSWIMANHPGGPAVINLSLGGPANSAIDDIVSEASRRGFVVVAAAGNNGGDACAVSPARAQGVVTIGATTSSDALASFTNTGNCVDMFAPGSGITSVWHTSQTATATLSGTSMAAPHVAGLVARLWQANPSDSADGVRSALSDAATSNPTAPSTTVLANFVDYVASEEESDDEACEDADVECANDEDAELVDQPINDDERDDERDKGPAASPNSGRPSASPTPGTRAPRANTPSGRPQIAGVTVQRDDSGVRLQFADDARADGYLVACTETTDPQPFGNPVDVRIAATAVSRTGARVTVQLPDQFTDAARCRISGIYAGSAGPASGDIVIPASANRPGSNGQPPMITRPDTPGSPPAVSRPDTPGSPPAIGRPTLPSPLIPDVQEQTLPGQGRTFTPPSQAGAPSPGRPNPSPVGPRR